MILGWELVRVRVLGILYMITFDSEDFHSLHFTSRMTDEGTLGHLNFRNFVRHDQGYSNFPSTNWILDLSTCLFWTGTWAQIGSGGLTSHVNNMTGD